MTVFLMVFRNNAPMNQCFGSSARSLAAENPESAFEIASSSMVGRLDRFQTQERPMADETLLTLTADIVSAHVANNSVSTSDLPALITNVHAALTGLGQPVEAEAPVQEPAVSIRASVKPDYIVCLEDGKKLKMLKRHLMSHYQMTPADYRAKWKLPADYPMTAPNYTEQRKGLAMRIGLGRKKEDNAEVEAEPAPKAARAKLKLPKIEAEPLRGE